MTDAPKKADDAAAQLRRILLALPKLDDDRAHAIGDIAASAGTDGDTLLRDLRVLIERNGGEPAGFVENVALAFDATSVRLEVPGFFRRPMGLTRTELHALELGLATLRQELPPEEHGTIERARRRLHEAIAGLPADPGGAPYAAHIGAESEERVVMRKQLQDCIAAHCVAELCYQRASANAGEWRSVRPMGFVYASGRWYLIALTPEQNDLRIFRTDRISEVRTTKQHFAAPASFSLADVVRDGRVLSGDPDATITVKYSPRVARWIAEREGKPLDADGSITVAQPLADLEWAVRHVLQYGDEAELLGPAEARTMIRERLQGMLAES